MDRRESFRSQFYITPNASVMEHGSDPDKISYNAREIGSNMTFSKLDRYIDSLYAEYIENRHVMVRGIIMTLIYFAVGLVAFEVVGAVGENALAIPSSEDLTFLAGMALVLSTLKVSGLGRALKRQREQETDMRSAYLVIMGLAGGSMLYVGTALFQPIRQMSDWAVTSGVFPVLATLLLGSYALYLKERIRFMKRGGT